jgi:hypothetical protein
MTLGTAALLLALAAAVDPVGDAPPAFETTTAPEPARPAITVVLLPTIGLGVDDVLRGAAGTALATRLADRAVIVDGGALPLDQQEALASCEGDACQRLLRPLGADAVVTSSLGPVEAELVLTVRVRTRAAVQRLQVRGTRDGVPDLAARAVTAMPLDGAAPGPTTAPPQPTTSKTPTTPTTPASSDDTVPSAAMVLLYFALGFVPIVGSPLFLPFVQGFAAQEVGPGLVGLEYREWGNAVAAGYLTYLVGFTVGGATYVGGAALAGSGASLGYGVMAGGALLVLATVAVEPVVFHLVSVSQATPVEPSR